MKRTFLLLACLPFMLGVYEIPDEGVYVIGSPRYANILAGQDFDTTNAGGCTVDESGVAPNVIPSGSFGAPDCNATGIVGAESMQMDASTDGVDTGVRWNQWHAPHSSGVIVWGFNVRLLVDDAISRNLPFFRAQRTTSLVDYPLIYVLDTNPDVWRIACSSGASGTSVETVALDTDYAVEVEWYPGDGSGPGSCTGLTPGCTWCGCLRIDGVQVAECDSGTAGSPPTGVYARPTADSYDMRLDNLFVCDEIPPTGTVCGDSDSFP